MIVSLSSWKHALARQRPCLLPGWCSAQRIKIQIISGGNYSMIQRCPRRGRMWNAGDNLICCMCSDLLKSNILVGLVLRTRCKISARIPHQSRLTPCQLQLRAKSRRKAAVALCTRLRAQSPGEAIAPAALRTLNDHLQIFDSPKIPPKPFRREFFYPQIVIPKLSFLVFCGTMVCREYLGEELS